METTLDLNEVLEKHESRIRHARAIQYALRGMKYIMGYLKDYAYEVKPVFDKNPVELHIKIYWAERDDDWERMAPVMMAKLKKLEEDLVRITQSVRYSQVSQAIKEDRSD
jgi:hypothetical protein